MIRVNTNGLYVLAEGVAEYLGVAYADVNKFIYPARMVLAGEISIEEAISQIEYESHARYDFIGALEEFDMGLALNPDIPYPDHTELEEGNLTYDVTYSLRELAARSWHLMNNTGYIESLFGFTLLVGIFLSSYPDFYHVAEVDFEPVLDAYSPLKLSILAKKLGVEYGKRQQANT